MARSSKRDSRARCRDRSRRKARIEREIGRRGASDKDKISPYQIEDSTHKVRQRFNGLELEEIIWILQTYGWQALAPKKKGEKHWLPETNHHKVPRSRGGTNDPDNIKKVDEKTHIAWHVLFENLTPKEIIKILEVLEWAPFIRGNSAKGRAKKIVFGERNLEECINYIKEEWV